MARPRKTPSTFLAACLRDAANLELLEPLAWELGYRDPRRTVPALTKHISEALPLESAAETIRGFAPGPRALGRWLFGRMADALSERDAGAAAVEGLRALAVPAYSGPVVERLSPRVAALTGGVIYSGEVTELGAAPEVVPRGVHAQVEAAQVRQRLMPLITSAGELRAHRLAVEDLRAALPATPRHPPMSDAQAWVQRAWRAAVRFGYRVGQPEPEIRAALTTLAGETPATFLAHLFAAWATEPTAEAPAAFELFGAAAWRLVSACDQPTPPAVHRILTLAALEALPVDQWVEIARFVDHLQREGLLPATCRGINRTFADPRTVPVTNLRPDHNEGEPFRLRLPFFLKLALGVPAQLGAVEFALAPKGESVFRFSAPRARMPAFEGPWSEVTHLRRTSLGAQWLDPLGPPPRDAAGGPGADGLDALADLLG